MCIRIQAMSDLLNRYLLAFRMAWKNRKTMEPVTRTRDEAEFLPATLALQETPVHPAPRIAMGLIIFFSFLALIWAIFGRVDVVATASGKIIPDSRSKIIQPMETASIRAIYVQDGQFVRRGEKLIELDSTITGAEIEKLNNEYLSAALEFTRYQALLLAQDANTTPILNTFPDGIGETRQHAEQQWVLGQFNAYVARLNQLEAVVVRREAEGRAIKAQVQKLRIILPLTRQREADYAGLLEKNHVSRHRYLELKSELIGQERDLVAQQERLAEISAAQTEAERDKIRWIAETRREWLDKLHDAERRSSSLQQELVKAESRGKFMSLTAPVDGVVQQLAVHTLGGVVTAAQALMVIVPRDGPIEVEALLPNKDIGFVRQGQEVAVKVETFSFTKYGTLKGEVIQVSSDAIQDEKLGLVFSIRVRLAEDSLMVEGNTVKLSPGMAVTVEIKTAKRRLIEYFLGPLLRYSDESLRER